MSPLFAYGFQRRPGDRLLISLAFSWPQFRFISCCCWWLGVWCLLLVTDVRAEHIIGGELTYRDLGIAPGPTNARTYQFTMRIIRDCQGNGSNFDGAAGAIPCQVTVYDGDRFYHSFSLDTLTINAIIPDPGIACVQVPPEVCLEEGIYRFPPITLPYSDRGYTVVYQRCCRNDLINNIYEPGASGATYFIEITAQAQRLGNSSPTFLADPPVVLCSGKDFVLSVAATDAEGDSLVYSFCTPFLGGGRAGEDASDSDGVAPNPDLPPPYASVRFRTNYSFATPLGTATSIVLEAATGEMRGLPRTQGRFVVGICVEEYRNGVLLSTVRRDFQFYVLACEATVVARVATDEISASEEFLLRFCGQLNPTLTNQSSLEEFIQQYRWELVLATGDTLVDTARHFAPTLPDFGTYRGRLLVNPSSDASCSDTALFVLKLFPNPVADYALTWDSCRVVPLQLADRSSADVVRWQWRIGDSLVSTERTFAYELGRPSSYPLQLVVSNGDGCLDSTGQLLTYYPVPAALALSVAQRQGCTPHTVHFGSAPDWYTQAPYTVDWAVGDGNTVMGAAATYTYTEPGIYSIGVQLASPLGCTLDTLLPRWVRTESSPRAGFTFAPRTASTFAPQIAFTDESESANFWQWQMGDEARYYEQHPQHSFRDTGQLLVTQIVANSSGCTDTLAQWIDIRPEVRLHFPSAFTPNGDGFNDFFGPVGHLEGYQAYQLNVWSRWGGLMFSSSSPSQGWNGTTQGNRYAPAGVYLYEARLWGPRHELIRHNGYITLIR